MRATPVSGVNTENNARDKRERSSSSEPAAVVIDHESVTVKKDVTAGREKRSTQWKRKMSINKP